MKRTIVGLFICLGLACGDTNKINAGSSSKNWKLVWNDEFDYTGLPDSNKWNYDVGTGCPNVCGWGNNELQYYTQADTANAMVQDGMLFIRALKQKKENNNYTSTRLVSKKKGDWLYGRMEVKAKLPAGRGLWPAIWMLSTDWTYGGWPESGEIDIMENVGHIPDTVFSSVHTKKFYHSIGTQKTKGLLVNDASTAFHVYGIEWYADRIDFFIDDNPFFSFKNTGNGFLEWPFDKRFHLILNLAVGGNWGGQKGVDESVFPAAMQVDYVRVFELKK
jgi:beta-glucanase (GH16 family)